MKKKLFLLFFNFVFNAYSVQTLGKYYEQKIINSKVAINAYNDVNRFSSEFDVDEKLITAIIQTESNFNPTAISKKGAIGFMQIMPKTAELLNIDPYDSTQNIYAGIKYFKQLLEINNNNIPLALAAYNAGMGNVVKYDSIPPFLETQLYIEKVLKTYNTLSGTKRIFYSNEFTNNSFEWGGEENEN